MNDKHPFNPLRLFRAVEMWLWYGRAWNVSLPWMVRFHHRPHAMSEYLNSKRSETDDRD